MAPPAIVRTPAEVRRAHNLLTLVLPIAGTIHLDDAELADIMAYASVLCWVLGHEYNPTFSHNLAELEARLRRHGFVLSGDSVLHRAQGWVN